MEFTTFRINFQLGRDKYLFRKVGRSIPLGDAVRFPIASQVPIRFKLLTHFRTQP